MIDFEKTNIINVKAEALVNSVNLKGVMGKGVALAFRETFPENYKLYKKACEEKIIDIYVTETGEFFPKYIINLPTKKHWRFPSQYNWIEAD
jgi:O-acetyl-ADP-ribose deacetylase (regulator of RNase III)